VWFQAVSNVGMLSAERNVNFLADEVNQDSSSVAGEIPTTRLPLAISTVVTHVSSFSFASEFHSYT
jgi:hypothetical protein